MAKLFCSKVSHNPFKEEMVTEITESVFEIDGYQVGDRLLEGILFFVYFDDSGVTKVTVNEKSRSYFEDNFNSKKFYSMVEKCANEILEEGDEVDVPSFIKEKYWN